MGEGSYGGGRLPFYGQPFVEGPERALQGAQAPPPGCPSTGSPSLRDQRRPTVGTPRPCRLPFYGQPFGGIVKTCGWACHATC